MRIRNMKVLCAIAIALGGSMGICVKQSTAVPSEVAIDLGEVISIATGGAYGTLNAGPVCLASSGPIGCALCVNTECGAINQGPYGNSAFAACYVAAMAVCVIGQ